LQLVFLNGFALLDLGNGLLADTEFRGKVFLFDAAQLAHTSYLSIDVNAFCHVLLH